MGRTVKVELELGVSRFVNPAKQGEKAIGDLDDALEDLDGKDLEAVAVAAEDAADSLDDMGRGARQAARHVDQLNTEINKAQTDLLLLAAQFAETADEAQRMDISKAIANTEAKLRNLSRSRNLLSALIPEPAKVAQAGGGLGSQLGQAVTTNLQNVMKSPAGVAAVSAGVVIAAPLIGATLSAAVIGGVGIGGVVGGALLAGRDPRIQQAGKTLGANLLRGLESDAAPMVEPLLGAIDLVEARFQRLRPALRRIFANSAEFVEPLVDDILTGVEGVITGMDQVLAQAGPVMDALGDLFADTGESFGRSLAIMAGGSEDAASALQFLNAVLSTTITSVGVTVRGLTEAWGAATWGPQQLREALQALRGEGENVSHWIDPASASAGGLGQNLYLMALKAQGAHGPIIGLTEQINELSDATRSAFDSATDMGEALDAANEAARKGARGIDANTKAGRENRTALSNLARAARDLYNAEVAVSGSGERANAVARRTRADFIRAATAMTGSKREAERLADALGLVKPPPKINVNVSVAQALINAQRIRNELSKIKSKTVRVHVQRTGEITYGSGGGRQAPQMAGGGPVLGPGPKGVDSELRLLAPGEHVMNDREVDAMGGQAAVAAFRRALMAGRGGGPAPARPTGIMPAVAGAAGRQVIEHRIVLEDRGELASLMLRSLRASPGTAATMATILARSN